MIKPLSALCNSIDKQVTIICKDGTTCGGKIAEVDEFMNIVLHDPPYMNIPAERSKNDMPRELFFTQEMKELLVSFIEDQARKQSDFLYLPKDIDPFDEVAVQKKIDRVGSTLGKTFRWLMGKPQFADIKQTVQTRGVKRYKIHLYSFKKFAFTVMADELGEIAARAIKGDREYVLTYYRKSREERAED